MSPKNPVIYGLLNGYSSKMSGGDQHFIKLLNFISRLHPVSVCLPAGIYRSNFSKLVTRIEYPHPAWANFFYRHDYLLFLLYIYRIVASTVALIFCQYDILISSSHLFFDIIPFLFLPGKRICITTIHHLIGEQDRRGWYRMITTVLEKISLKILRYRQVYCFTVSPLVAEILITRYKFNPDYILSTSNGIDLSRIKKYAPSRRPFDLVYCGRLHYRKGVYTLLQIVKELLPEFPDLKLAMIGDGPERYDLRAEAIRHNIQKNIKFFGHAGEKIKYGLIKSAKVFVLPSFEEGWGIVIAESLACRTPVIVSALPELKDIWKSHVIWANQLNIASFTNRVRALLNQPKKRRKIASRGFDYIRQLSWDRILKSEYKKITEIYLRKFEGVK